MAIFFGCLFALTVSGIIIWGVLKRIKQVVNAMQQVTSGDGQLRHRLEIVGRDEITQLSTSYNFFIEKLENVINLIVGSSANLSKEAILLTEDSEKLKTSAEEQSNGIEMLAQRLELLNQQSSDILQQASTTLNASEETEK